MKDMTNKEMLFVLSIFKSPEIEYNASTMAKHLGMSAMGALKIAKRLEGEGILISRQLGNAKFYKLKLSHDYAEQYVKFLLKREAEQAVPYVKRWISEIKKIRNADIGILFGSVLRKASGAADIDVLLVTDKNRYAKLRKEIDQLNFLNDKKLHPVYQSKEDLNKNLKKVDKAILNAIKGIVVFGEDMLVSLLKA